jgi:outer membrane protein TolC
VLDALKSAQETQLKAAEAQLQAGAVDRLEVLASQLELNTVELARFEAQVKLQQAVGGVENAVQRPFELPGWIFEETNGEKKKEEGR